MKMESTKIMSRMYKDGIMDKHTESETKLRCCPIYTMFRAEPGINYPHSMMPVYTIVCDYRDGEHISNMVFTSLKTCFRVFRRLVDVD